MLYKSIRLIQRAAGVELEKKNKNKLPRALDMYICGSSAAAVLLMPLIEKNSLSFRFKTKTNRKDLFYGTFCIHFL